jgi:hypothetical protein
MSLSLNGAAIVNFIYRIYVFFFKPLYSTAHNGLWFYIEQLHCNVVDRLNLTNTSHSVMLEPPTFKIGAAQLTMLTTYTLASTHGWTQTTSKYNVHDTIPNIDQQVFFPCTRLKGKEGK